MSPKGTHNQCQKWKRGIAADAAEFKQIVTVHFKKCRWNKWITRKTFTNYQNVHKNTKIALVTKLNFIITNCPTRKFQAQMCTAAPREMCRNVYSIIIYNSLKLETGRMSSNKRREGIVIQWRLFNNENEKKKKSTQNYYYKSLDGA